MNILLPEAKYEQQQDAAELQWRGFGLFEFALGALVGAAFLWGVWGWIEVGHG